MRLCRVPTTAIYGTYLTKIINKYAAEDALFAADDGTPTVWMLRHIDTGGKRRTFASLLHGTMAGGMASALGLQKCQPGRQVVCLAGDGGFAMLLGDLLTTVQENLPIKIVVYDICAATAATAASVVLCPAVPVCVAVFSPTSCSLPTSTNHLSISKSGVCG